MWCGVAWCGGVWCGVVNCVRYVVGCGKIIIIPLSLFASFLTLWFCVLFIVEHWQRSQCSTKSRYTKSEKSHHAAGDSEMCYNVIMRIINICKACKPSVPPTNQNRATEFLLRIVWFYLMSATKRTTPQERIRERERGTERVHWYYMYRPCFFSAPMLPSFSANLLETISHFLCCFIFHYSASKSIHPVQICFWKYVFVYIYRLCFMLLQFCLRPAPAPWGQSLNLSCCYIFHYSASKLFHLV